MKTSTEDQVEGKLPKRRERSKRPSGNSSMILTWKPKVILKRKQARHKKR